MSRREVGVVIPPDERLAVGDLTALGRQAEALGFDVVAIGEVAGAESFALLGMLAATTSRVTLGTCVIPMASRSAPLIAMGFATLASAVPGRVFAGVGVSSPNVVSRWHGRRFDRPLSQVREFIPALRSALAGEKLDVDGAVVKSQGYRLALPPAQVPIVLGAFGPKMLALAGELADGVVLAWCPLDEVEGRVRLVREGAERAGRDPDSIQILHVTFAYAGDAVEQARARMRRDILGYATVSTHRKNFERSVARLDEVDALWQAGNREAALALIDNRAVDRLSAIGTPDHVARHVRDLWEAGVGTSLLLTIGAKAKDAEGPHATVVRVGEALALGERVAA